MTWEQHCDRGSQKDSRLARKYHNFCFFLSKITILYMRKRYREKLKKNKDDAKIACDEASSEEFEESSDENNMDRY